MKLVTEFVLAAVVVVGFFADSVEMASQNNGNFNTVDPRTLPKGDPSTLDGLGPAILPGMPGYGKNEKFNEAWKEYLSQEASHSGSAGSNCAQVCPDVYRPVCGSDGVTYSNSCFLGLASCNNPEKHITTASDDACTKSTTQSIQS